MSYTLLVVDPKIYLALLIINIAVIFVFFLGMSEATKGKLKNKNINTVNSWWMVLMVFVLALIVSMQNVANSWILLLMIPMVNLTIATLAQLIWHRWDQLHKLGYGRVAAR